MNESVAVVGGGVAGLTAAHELIKRGFKVHVYERRSFFGGKAASYRVPKTRTARATKDDPPGEHGFRFFPGWYRHVFATMREIPYREKKTLYQGATVADNLVEVRTSRLAWLGRPTIDLPLQVPRNVTEAVSATQFLASFGELGLSAGEVKLFFGKLVEIAAMSEAERVDRLDKISWWEFLECDDPARSQAYTDFIRATTRTMVAAKAEEASAYTIGRIAIRTFLDTMTSVDRVLNGPTNEIWIEPWIDHLKRKGVVFHTEMELDSIQFDAKSRRVRRLFVQPVVIADVRRLRGLIDRSVRAPDDVDRDDVREMLSLMDDLLDTKRFKGIVPEILTLNLRQRLKQNRKRVRAIHLKLAPAFKKLRRKQEELEQADPARAAALQVEIQNLQGEIKADRAALTAVLKKMDPFARLLAKVEAAGAKERPVDADYFVLALPLEQLAYHVNRSQMLTFLAPKLRNVVRLSRHMDWMAGIQFYLNRAVSVSPGHLVGMDSPWALTAIESTRFWKDVTFPPGVKSILSVDISAWDRRGLRTRKPAFNCTNGQIALEVWAQLRQMLNRKEAPPVLRKDMLVGGSLKRNRSYHLDESIVDLRDRKKQAFYERARGVRFNTLDLIRQSDEQATSDPEDRYMWGPRLRFNAEPLLINRPGSHNLRPEVTSEVSNLFLAGDYVRTETDLATMEGANEAGRRAVNAVLKAAGSHQEACELFPFSPGRQAVGAVMAFGGALRAFEGAASTVQDRFWKPLALGMMRAKTNRQLP
jgi:uncharacterized protein with NAD-binding domain and iron-sulfur cluster